MQVKLIVVGGKANRTEVQLQLPAVLGRGRDADLTLGHSSISRRHCRLWEEQGQVMVEDLQSTNGTFVEDQRVDRAVLEPGARLRVGPLTFVVVYDRPRSETPTTVPLGEADVLSEEAAPEAEEESILLAAEPDSPEAPESITPAAPAELAGSGAEPEPSPSAPEPAEAGLPVQAAPPAAEQTEVEEPPEATPPVSEQAEAEALPPVAEQATVESDSAAVLPQESPPAENPVEELSRELTEENQEDEALRRFLEELQ